MRRVAPEPKRLSIPPRAAAAGLTLAVLTGCGATSSPANVTPSDPAAGDGAADNDAAGDTTGNDSPGNELGGGATAGETDSSTAPPPPASESARPPVIDIEPPLLRPAPRNAEEPNLERLPGPNLSTDDLTVGGALGSTAPLGSFTSIVLRDADRGDHFDALGRPYAGEGPALVPLPGYNQFWFAWSVFNHGSSIFGRDALVESGPIELSDVQPSLGCPGTDCIPALTEPELVEADEASYLEDHALVIGVAAGEDVRAYPHNVMWWHEIVNTEVGGVPIAITHCPLTFSSIAHDPTRFSAQGEPVELGVSGRLYNSNLVFYDRNDQSWYSQLLGVAVDGDSTGKFAPRVHVWEMTWGAWRAAFPNTRVVSTNTGHARDYQDYPYGSYFVDDTNTFRATNPPVDPSFPAKAWTYGVHLGTESKAYVHEELAQWAATTYGDDAPAAGVLNDEIGGQPVAIVFDVLAGYVQAFSREGVGELELVGIRGSQ